MSKHRLQSYLFLIAAATIWGAAAPIVKFTFNGIDPFSFLAYRFLISAVIAILFFIIARPKIRKPKYTIPFSMLHGTIGYSIALSALFVGLNSSTVLELSLIAAIGPLLVILGGALFFKDHFTKREQSGTTIALIGVILTIFTPILLNNELKFSANIMLLVFLLADTASVLFAKFLLQKKISPAVLSNLSFIAAGAFFLIIVTITPGLPEFFNIIKNLKLEHHLGVWYMAVFSGSLAYYFSIRGRKSIEISETALFAYLQPIFTIPLAIFWLGESITPMFILGAIIITIGVFIAETKVRKNRK